MTKTSVSHSQVIITLSLSEMHRDVHGPLHGLVQRRVEGLHRPPPERKSQHVEDLFQNHRDFENISLDFFSEDSKACFRASVKKY